MNQVGEEKVACADDLDPLHQATFAAVKFALPNRYTWLLSGQFDQSGITRYVAINTTPFRVGRRCDLSLSLPYSAVSNLHAEIKDCDGRIWVRDTGSTNGTFVNGSRIAEETRLNDGDLIQFANIAMRVMRRNDQTCHQTSAQDVCDLALALTRFDDLMSQSAVVPHFQPIVALADQRTVAYEVLGRSRLFGLKNPYEMFRAAAHLNLETALSRLLRREGVSGGQSLPDQRALFVNTHPLELNKPGELVQSLRELLNGDVKQPIVLEIHESAVTNLETMRPLRATLRELGIGLAYDDFGAGQARLVELFEMRPDYLKFDMKLIQGISNAPAQRQQMLATLVRMARDLGISPLAEGVETSEDAEMCREIGFDLGQGFYYGRPVPADSRDSGLQVHSE